MKNLLIALGIAAVSFTIAALVTSSWVAGLLPALLFGGVAYALLARRTMKKLEAIALQAGAAAQAGDVQGARTGLEAALLLGKEQFLVAEQIHGQLGMLDYMEAMQPFVEAVAQGKKAPPITVAATKLGAARTHFEKAWSRDWRAKSILAIIHQREGRPKEALDELEKTSGVGEKEPIFWGVYTWACYEGQNREQAMQVVARGLKANPGHAALAAIQESLSNQKRPEFRIFGDTWTQFFPDHVTREQLFEMLKAAGKVPAGAQLPSANTPPRTFRPVGPTPPPPRGGRMPRG